jgi:hypothetical protein
MVNIAIVLFSSRIYVMNRVFLIWRLIGLAWLSLASTAQAVTCENNLPASNPDAVYTDNGDGTVTDTRTGLMWKQCVEGRSRANCDTGSSITYTWAEALVHAEAVTFAGYSDWRLPNIKELRSLVEECRTLPAINDTLFPNERNSFVWSGSPDAYDSSGAWFVYFADGGAYYGYSRIKRAVVRLVRGGQSFEIFDLNVSKSGTGRGTVTSFPSGIDCGFDCSENYAASTSVQLAARPDTGYKFDGWGGACSGTVSTCMVNMDSSKTVSATFTDDDQDTAANYYRKVNAYFYGTFGWSAMPYELAEWGAVLRDNKGSVWKPQGAGLQQSLSDSMGWGTDPFDSETATLMVNTILKNLFGSSLDINPRIKRYYIDALVNGSVKPRGSVNAILNDLSIMPRVDGSYGQPNGWEGGPGKVF